MLTCEGTYRAAFFVRKGIHQEYKPSRPRTLHGYLQIGVPSDDLDLEAVVVDPRENCEEEAQRGDQLPEKNSLVK